MRSVLVSKSKVIRAVMPARMAEMAGRESWFSELPGVRFRYPISSALMFRSTSINALIAMFSSIRIRSSNGFS